MISALRLIDLAVTRGDRRLFVGLSADFAAGEAVAVTGANGSGKTSLLRAIAGLIRPSDGKITFDGEAGPLEAADARQGLHLMGHLDGLKPGWTAREELSFQARWLGGGSGLDTAAEALDIGRLLDLEIRKLSAGQRRRVALARLIAAPRPLWLLDEPFAPLDAAHREAFGAAMAAHLSTGGIIIAAVHDPLPIPARALELA